MSRPAIDLIVPAYKPRRYIEKMLLSLPENVRAILVDDSSPNGEEIKAVAEDHGALYARLPYPDDEHRLNEASCVGFEMATAPIVGRVDDDSIFPGFFFDRVEAVLSRYSNLVAWGQRILSWSGDEYRFSVEGYDGYMEWSTIGNIVPRWHSANCDANVFLRRSFLEHMGGWVTTPGWGGTSDDFCSKAAAAGGVIAIFADLVYLHQEHSGDVDCIGRHEMVFREREIVDEVSENRHELVEEPLCLL